MVIDGADNTENMADGSPVDLGVDIEYTLDDSTVTVQFSGFESSTHGVMKFEQAIGTQPGGEEVLGFTEFGVVHTEETGVVGDGKYRKLRINKV